ncbi:UDP-glucosyltransferase 2-like [Condylostylus longicornis]|uniref:UDP-glucosyltransferase 2-like n=1 Tax=Condylostylus longicornis TaxID=2530218 RepID=UPI00244DDBF5|nr:UDP-glucosyltransferase 2-like [Condylostylus longicornis]
MNYLRILLSIILISAISIESIESARILCVFTTIIKSHLIIHESLARGLVEHGHNVTVITTIPLPKKNPGFEHIEINMPSHQEEFVKVLSKLNENSKINEILRKTNLLTESITFLTKCAIDVIKSEKIQEIFKTREYDLVILGYFFNEIQLGIADHFKCPVIISWVNTNIVNTDIFVGNPLEMSYIPSIFAELKTPLNFFDRVVNFLIIVYEKLRQYDLLSQQEEVYREIFPPQKGYRSLNEMLRNVSVLFQATHFCNKLIKPMTVNTIEIGGIQVKEKSDPLPEDLKKFLDDAKDHGAIYFSLGTNVNSSDLDQSTINKMFNVFKKLPQNIIWKWEKDNIKPGKSSNILFRKWLPQNDILAHPNIKLFISHGGNGGITEARHHAVPIVGLPLLGDQFTNLKNVKTSGWGLFLDIKNLNETDFYDTIQEVLYNNSYRDNIKRISKIFKDRPLSPMKTAIYWIEYTLRYNGASHLQSLAIHMPFWKLYSIDVIIFLFIIIYLIWILVKILIKYILRFCYNILIFKILRYNKEKIN